MSCCLFSLSFMDKMRSFMPSLDEEITGTSLIDAFFEDLFQFTIQTEGNDLSYLSDNLGENFAE
eukprot:CAMPEP_0184365360 /NCGR_PEP_ID=MMETSP1089-20130417/148321_1 /TAXON_ID=38269 ORGANISM="Gloeochaete wittrockiana, Strain SAG46.84" /NCGR_SAMPLE_ID=MMETSP1089 /ASSEMBLY_ACC=CAM_ASM_000445 /LENGTH=63 /DNA_ID=CAMNT_0026706535 /DNA_START=51 /DNA_END=242 /DNA_ORIENTATION=+